MQHTHDDLLPLVEPLALGRKQQVLKLKLLAYERCPSAGPMFAFVFIVQVDTILYRKKTSIGTEMGAGSCLADKFAQLNASALVEIPIADLQIILRHQKPKAPIAMS